MARWGARSALMVSMVVLAAACGGGGGGGGGGTGGGGPTPVPNQICDSTNQLCIGVDRLVILTGPNNDTRYIVTLRNASGRPRAGVPVTVSGTSALRVDPSTGQTNGQGQLIGTVEGLFAASATLRAEADGLSVSVRMSVQGAPPNTATPTTGGTPGGPTPTATPMDVPEDVTTIYMEADPFTVSSQNGGTVNIYAIIFDQNNRPVNDVSVIFDFAPKVGFLRPIATITRHMVLPDGSASDGVARVQIIIPPGVAAPGQIAVSASAGDVQGAVTFTVLPGTATRRIATVLAQISDATCGTDNGGSLTLRSVVLDADNSPVDGVNVLFITPVGEVIPLVATTREVSGQGGTAVTTLQIPPGSPVLVDDSGNVLPYTITARVGGVEGQVNLFVVPGREECIAGDRGVVSAGEAASATFSASPNRIRVRGSGVRELSTIVVSVFENQGARLEGAEVRFALSPLSRAAGAVLLPLNLSGGYCSEDRSQPCADNADCPPGQTCVVDPRNRFITFTDRAGNAQIQLRSGTGLGTVTVTAEIPSALGPEFTEPCSDPRTPGERCIITDGIVVTVTAGLPGRLSLTVNNAAIDNNEGTRLTTLTAIVTDASANTVEDGTPVSYTVVPFGPDDTQSQRVGIVGFPLTNSPPPCDVSQYVVQTGIPVVPQPGNAITCLTFPLDMEGTDVQVQVEAGSVTSLRTITLPGVVDDFLSVANPTTVVVTDSGPGSSLITAVTRDRNGNPVRNVKVNFETELGIFRSTPPQFLTSAVTDINGVATATLTIPAGTPDGTEVDVTVFGGGRLRINGLVETLTVESSGPNPGAGQPQVITLKGANPATIGVRASGRPDQSVVSFAVRDRLNNPLEGIVVRFFVNAVGGVTITPEAITDANGIARASVLAGTQATAVQITATVDVNDDGLNEIVNQFTPVNIVGGVPNADRFSLAAEFGNIAGRVTFGLEDQITAFLNDHFGNAVAPTAVNFTTNGASVFNQVQTDEAGRAATTLISEGGVPDDGIITVMATTRGEESFVDSNGNGARDADEPFTDVPEPFIDANFNGRYDAPEDFTDANANRRFDPGEAFVDANLNGRYDAHEAERFTDVNGNEEWDAAQSPGVWDANALLSTSIPITFSAGTRVQIEPQSFIIPAGGAQEFVLFVGDRDFNPLVGGSQIRIEVDGEGAEIFGVPDVITLPDSQTFGALVPGLNLFSFVVVDSREGTPTTATNLAVDIKVDSDLTGDAPGGNGSVFVSVLGQLLPAPTQPAPPTPTETQAPATVTPTATATVPPTATQTATAAATETETPPPTLTVTATATP